MTRGIGFGIEYDRWQEALAAEFLEHGGEPGPVFLFVDDAACGELRPEVKSPAASLAAAARAALQLESRDPFGLVERRAKEWLRSGNPGVPPILPVLAATVLAATRMQRDGRASALAYYPRLAEFLSPAAAPPQLEALTDRLRHGGFESAVALWTMFDRWLADHAGSYGQSTVATSGHFRLIGYPLSQALVRAQDRFALTAFFGKVQELPEDDDSLTAGLRLWFSRSRGQSRDFLKALSGEKTSALVCEVVRRLRSEWDGRVLEAAGRRRLRLRLCLDLDRWRASGVVSLADGADSLAVTWSGQAIELRRPDYGNFYDLAGNLPAPTRWLDRAVHADGPDCRLVRQPTDVLTLAQEPLDGRWVENDGVTPFARLLIAVAAGRRQQVENLIQQAADPGWSLLHQRPTAALLPEWCIFRNVVFSNPDALEAAVSALATAGLAGRLRPDTPPFPQLVGGLPVSTELGRHHYLAGGEPDLVLPVGTEARTVETSLDNQKQQPPFRATGFPIPLRRLGPFRSGDHVILADSSTVRFRVLERAPSPGRPQAAAATSPVAPPALIRRGAQTFALTWRGAWVALTEPARPAWQVERGLPVGYYWQAVLPPDTAWVLRVRRGRAAPPDLVRYREPNFSGITEESAALWRTHATGLDGQPQHDLWHYYQHAWERRASRR